MSQPRINATNITTIAFGFIAMAVTVAAAPVVVLGKWVLSHHGESAPSDDFLRGFQTSGLAWDGVRLWSVGDQRAAYPGHLYAIDPQTGRLIGPPLSLAASDPLIEAHLKSWGRLDLEGIATWSASEKRFVVLVEDKVMAALVVQVDDTMQTAMVQAIWMFRFPNDAPPEPYRHDPNYRLEGIAIDDVGGRGYVAFERDVHGRPWLFQFSLSDGPATGSGTVGLEPLGFTAWDQLAGKPASLLNVNGLEFARSHSGEPRLFVLCRDREMFFVINPDNGRLVDQMALSLRSPEGEMLEWASPEGIAIDPRRGLVFVVNDPDSTDGNYRLRSTPAATGRFAHYVPLLFEIKMTRPLR